MAKPWYLLSLMKSCQHFFHFTQHSFLRATESLSRRQRCTWFSWMPNFRHVVHSRCDSSLEECVIGATKNCHCAGHINKKQALSKKTLEAGTPSTPTKNAKWRPDLFRALWLLLAQSGYCWLSSLTWSEGGVGCIESYSIHLLLLKLGNYYLQQAFVWNFILKALCYISDSVVGILWKLENSWKVEMKTVTPKLPYWCTELRVKGEVWLWRLQISWENLTLNLN